MFLSKVVVNTRDRETLTHLEDADFWHKRVMSAFENLNGIKSPRKEMGILFRKEIKNNVVILYVQSLVEPNWYGKTWVVDAQIKNLSDFYSALNNNMILHFSLLSIPYYNDESVLKKDKAKCFKTNEDKIEWLKRKETYCGFVIETISIVGNGEYLGNIGGNKKGLYMTNFVGTLRITDIDKFRKCYMEGLGRQKSYGAGMLLLA